MASRGWLFLALLSCTVFGQEPPEAPEYVVLREKESAENAELSSRAEQAASREEQLKVRRTQAEQRLERAKDRKKQISNAYARDVSDEGRLTKDEVLYRLGQLRKDTDERVLAEDLKRLEAEEQAIRDRRERVDDLLTTHEEDFAALRRKAKETFEKAKPEGSFAIEEARWDAVRTERFSQLKQLQKLYGTHLRQVLALADLRRLEHAALRDALIRLQQENLFLRGKSDLSWDAVKKGLSDTSRLPGWLATAAGSVGRYVAGPGGGALLRLGGFVLLAGVAVFLLGLLAQRRHERIPEDALLRRQVWGIAARLARTVGVAAVLFLLFYGASALLPDLGHGVRGLLAALGGVVGGFWIARALARSLKRASAGDGAWQPPPRAAARLSFGIRLLAWLSLVFLPVLFALDSLGYENRGAREALWLLYEVVVGIVIVAVLLRRRLLLGLFAAPLYQTLVKVLQPLAVLLVPFLLLLDALSYDILAGLITRFSVAALVGSVVGLYAHRLCTWLALAWIERTYAEDEERREAAQGALRYALGVVFFFLTLWIFLLLSGSDLGELRGFLEVPLPFQAPDAEQVVTWWNVLTALVLLVVFLKGVGPAKDVLAHQVLSRTKLEPGLRYTITTLFGYVLLTIGLFVGVRQVIDLTNLGYVVAALSVGIGFGLQEIVSNFISGLILLFERPLKVGDLVQVGDTEGVVRRINIRATTVQTLDNSYLLVPNKEFITQTVVNFAHTDPKLRLHIGVGVSYGSDTAKVRDVLLDVAAAHDKVLEYPAPVARFVGFGNSSLDFDLLVWIRNPPQKEPVMSELRYAIFDAFREHGIEIPFPQRDLHVRSVKVPIPVERPTPDPEDGPS